MFSYGLGALFVLFFLAVFYGIFSTIAPNQEFAFSKRRSTFPRCPSSGRLDLLLVYLMTIILLFYYCFILQLAVYCFSMAIGTKKRVLTSIILNLALYLFVSFFNKNYNAITHFIADTMFWIFPLFADVIPLLCLFLKRGKREKKEAANA